MKRPLLWIAPILAGFALTVPAPKARAADDAPPFGESIDVRVVNVEAVVTDRAGHRVTGLKPSDFRLRVDGKEVPIEYFNEINDGQALAPPAADGQAAKPTAAPAVQGVAEGAVGTYYLVFIDDYFAVASKRDSILRSIKGDLSRLGPNDRMAIVAYDGGRLAMLSSWSGSPADLAKAFDKAMERKPRGLDRLKEQRELVHDDAFASQATADGAPLDLNVLQTGLNDRQRVYAEGLVRQLKGDVQAAVSTMRALAAPQGRKVMLLLSGGWPFSINTYISGGVGLPIKQIPDGEEIFRPLANTANLLGYTLYPVDLPGGTADSDAEGTAPNALQRQPHAGVCHRQGGHPLLLLAGLLAELAGQRQGAPDQARGAELRPEGALAHRLPRPLAQGSGVDGGGERPAVRHSAGRPADADEGGGRHQVGPRGDRDPAHPRPAREPDDGGAGGGQVHVAARAAHRRLG
jgi:VWFA-related protein